MGDIWRALVPAREYSLNILYSKVLYNLSSSKKLSIWFSIIYIIDNRQLTCWNTTLLFTSMTPFVTFIIATLEHPCFTDSMGCVILCLFIQPLKTIADFDFPSTNNKKFDVLCSPRASIGMHMLLINDGHYAKMTSSKLCNEGPVVCRGFG